MTAGSGVAVQATEVPPGIDLRDDRDRQCGTCASARPRPRQQMTTVADFTTKIQQTLQTLQTQLPGVKIMIASVPNWYRVWQDFPTKTRPAGTCPLLFSSSATTDTRDAVSQRVIAYNDVLAAACAAAERLQVRRRRRLRRVLRRRRSLELRLFPPLALGPGQARRRDVAAQLVCRRAAAAAGHRAVEHRATIHLGNGAAGLGAFSHSRGPGAARRHRPLPISGSDVTAPVRTAPTSPSRPGPRTRSSRRTSARASE